MQVEVSSGKYLQHATSAAAQEGNVGPQFTHDQVMSQLAELDKLGQEGAAPVDDAEVGVIATRLYVQFSCISAWQSSNDRANACHSGNHTGVFTRPDTCDTGICPNSGHCSLLGSAADQCCFEAATDAF